jgi:hypothetical protein
MAFFIITAVKTSDLSCLKVVPLKVSPLLWSLLGVNFKKQP